MNQLSSQDLLNLKTIKLPGELKLTHKPVLPSLIPYASRPIQFLEQLREVREKLPFKAGPSKKPAAASGDDEGSGDAQESSTSPAKKDRSTKIAAKLSIVKGMSEDEKAMLADLFSEPVTKRKKK